MAETEEDAESGGHRNNEERREGIYEYSTVDNKGPFFRLLIPRLPTANIMESHIFKSCS